MTTVAWDGRTFASDRRMGEWRTANKQFELPDGRVLSGAGYMDDLAEVAAWLTAGGDERDKPVIGDDDTDFLLVDGAKCYWLTCPFLRPIEVLDGMAAIGSGSAYALGAMAAGKSAAEAVEIAARFDPHTGGGVDCHPKRKTK